MNVKEYVLVPASVYDSIVNNKCLKDQDVKSINDENKFQSEIEDNHMVKETVTDKIVDQEKSKDHDISKDVQKDLLVKKKKIPVKSSVQKKNNKSTDRRKISKKKLPNFKWVSYN